VKINLDGAYFVGTGEGGWGYVIRNAEGIVHLACAGSLRRLTKALQAKAVCTCDRKRNWKKHRVL